MPLSSLGTADLEDADARLSAHRHRNDFMRLALLSNTSSACEHSRPRHGNASLEGRAVGGAIFQGENDVRPRVFQPFPVPVRTLRARAGYVNVRFQHATGGRRQGSSWYNAARARSSRDLGRVVPTKEVEHKVAALAGNRDQ